MSNKYDFYDLEKVEELAGRPETIEIDGYYWDPTDLPPKDYLDEHVPLEFKNIGKWMRSKMNGLQTRETMARLAEMVGINTRKAVDAVEENKVRQDTLEEQFDAIQRDSTGKDVVSSMEIVAARGGKPTLGARLDETTAQLLAHKAAQDEMLDKFAKNDGVQLSDFYEDSMNGDYALALTEAITYANQNNYTKIYASNGEYTFLTKPTLQPNISIIGESRKTIFTFNVQSAELNSMILDVIGDFLEVKNITFKRSGGIGTLWSIKNIKRVLFDNCEFGEFSPSVWVYYADDVRFINCDSLYNPAGCITISYCTGGLIEGCRFFDTGEPIDLNEENENITMRNCHFKGGTSTDELIDINRKTHNITIDNCILEDRQKGLLISASDMGTQDTSTNVRVINCTFKNLTEALITYGVTGYADNFTIENNLFDGCVRSIMAYKGHRGLSIIGNKILNGTQGILFFNDPKNPLTHNENVTIKDNIIRNMLQMGLLLDYIDNLTLLNNQIDNCGTAFSGSDPSNHCGVLTKGNLIGTILIQGGLITNNAVHGIYVWSTVTINLSNVLMSGNGTSNYNNSANVNTGSLLL